MKNCVSSVVADLRLFSFRGFGHKRGARWLILMANPALAYNAQSEYE